MKRMESESEVKVGFDPNGNFMMMIVIDSRRSRRVIILAISRVVVRWLITENGMKITSVFSITKTIERGKFKLWNALRGFWETFILVAEQTNF